MPAIDPEKQKQAREYARISRRIWLASTLFSLAYGTVWLASGWAVGLRQWLESFSSNEWLLVAAFAAVFGGISALIELPLGYYTGFVLPHRFGQSNQSLKDWIVDGLKGMAIGLPVGLFLLEMFYLALRASGPGWWLWVTAGLLVFNVLVSNLAPVLILPIFNKYVPLGEEHAELAKRLVKLAEKANTRVRGVFKFDMSRRTKAANAALTGIGNTRRIILGDTLINEFSTDEIETILAHELGHHVHKDIPLSIAFETVVTAVGLFLVSLAMNWATGFFGFSSAADVAGMPALLLVFSLFGLLSMPLENGFSRWRERMADEYALESTGKKEAFASGFERLANQNLGEIDPEAWVVWLFYSHPPLGERIKMAREWK